MAAPPRPHAVLSGAHRCTGGVRNVRKALEAQGFNLGQFGTPKLKKKLERFRKAVLLVGLGVCVVINKTHYIF